MSAILPKDGLHNLHVGTAGGGQVNPSKPGEPGVETYTILTTEPNDLLSDIHDRMPVIVQAADYDEWLNTGSPELLRPLPSEMVEIAKA